jgi:hypothetical protein
MAIAARPKLPPACYQNAPHPSKSAACQPCGSPQKPDTGRGGVLRQKSEALWQCGVPVFWGQPSVGQSPKQKPFTACFGAEGGITERRLPAALGKVAGVYDPQRPLKAFGWATATQRLPPFAELKHGSSERRLPEPTGHVLV